MNNVILTERLTLVELTGNQIDAFHTLWSEYVDISFAIFKLQRQYPYHSNHCTAQKQRGGVYMAIPRRLKPAESG